jgi:hypothetical protein
MIVDLLPLSEKKGKKANPVSVISAYSPDSLLGPLIFIPKMPMPPLRPYLACGSFKNL